MVEHNDLEKRKESEEQEFQDPAQLEVLKQRLNQVEQALEQSQKLNRTVSRVVVPVIIGIAVIFGLLILIGILQFISGGN
ncbi:hypothetical protein [Paenibacillus senegalimassiliensis]|uniref:hypothetical protein n=1 Tax=Paenibacillus senegalimassiliensis TaxID=1737426 RepID=UPI00073F8A1B|nr:hypothetical protein [Paenibacillus senegalimassiliensis]